MLQQEVECRAYGGSRNRSSSSWKVRALLFLPFFCLRTSRRVFFSGFSVVGAAVLLLLLHLGHPLKAWRAPYRVGKSWISRGTATIICFLGLAILYTILDCYTGFLSSGPARSLMKVLLLAACLIILSYPGFTLSYSSSIPFWNNGLVPLTFILCGLTTGISWFLVAGRTPGAVSLPIVLADMLLLLFLAVILPSYLIVAGSSGAGARESVRLLLSGGFLWIFVGLGLGVGILVPLVLCGLMLAGYTWETLTLFLAVSRGIGDVAVRYAIVKAGVYDAVY